MVELLRFYPLEIVSQVWIMIGDRKCRDVVIQSIVLVPRGCLKQKDLSELSEIIFPEIFLQ